MVELCWHSHPVSAAFDLTACCPLTFRGRNGYEYSAVKQSTPTNMKCICTCLIGCQLDFDSIEQVHERCRKLQLGASPVMRFSPVMWYFFINRLIRLKSSRWPAYKLKETGDAMLLFSWFIKLLRNCRGDSHFCFPFDSVYESVLPIDVLPHNKRMHVVVLCLGKLDQRFLEFVCTHQTNRPAWSPEMCCLELRHVLWQWENGHSRRNQTIQYHVHTTRVTCRFSVVHSVFVVANVSVVHPEHWTFSLHIIKVSDQGFPKVFDLILKINSPVFEQDAGFWFLDAMFVRVSVAV